MQGRITEIFRSIQGEGLWVGRPQVFVRFHSCRLRCQYCDTPLIHQNLKQARIELPSYSKKFIEHPLFFDAIDLDAWITKYNLKSLALTGGEPLEQAPFIAHWLSQNSYEVLLETSGIESEALLQVLPYIHLISMDIKLSSATGERPLWKEHAQFIQVAGETPLYAKIVYDETMTFEEQTCLKEFITRFSSVICYVFQPISPLRKRNIKKCLQLFDQFVSVDPKRVRLIPQMHKFLSVL